MAIGASLIVLALAGLFGLAIVIVAVVLVVWAVTSDRKHK